MYFGWEPLRDIGQPKSLARSSFIHARGEDDVDNKLTDMALSRIRDAQPDFVFLYLVETDEKGGHDNGWMSQEYLRRISIAIDNAKRMIENFGDEYTVIIMADHGGHDRTHGTELPEDMTIPLFFCGPDFIPGETISDASLLDIAPTIAEIMGFAGDSDWEGKSLTNK